MKWTSSVFVMLAMISPFLSANQCINDDEKKITILFSTGANTSYSKAIKYAWEMKNKLIRVAKANSNRMTNVTAADLAAVQVLPLPNSIELPHDMLNELWQQFKALGEAQKLNPDGSVAVSVDYKNKLADIFKQIDADDEDFERQLAYYKFIFEGISDPKYTAHLPNSLKNSNALIAGHSQGNMYYEALYNAYLAMHPELTDKRYKVISIGSPVQLTHYNSYVLDKHDFLSGAGGFDPNTEYKFSVWNIFNIGAHSYLNYIDEKNPQTNPDLNSSKVIDEFLMSSIEDMDYSHQVSTSNSFVNFEFQVPADSGIEPVVYEYLLKFTDSGYHTKTYVTAANREYYKYNPASESGYGVLTKSSIGEYDTYKYSIGCAAFEPNYSFDRDDLTSTIWPYIYYPESAVKEEDEDDPEKEVIVSIDNPISYASYTVSIKPHDDENDDDKYGKMKTLVPSHVFHKPDGKFGYTNHK
ncbi:MAG TPA: hypothetical protein DCL21_06640 [Alphaproteobacteria bacterium]|nr:hypothetical protein [Alphaproteobacteria bacterium]